MPERTACKRALLRPISEGHPTDNKEEGGVYKHIDACDTSEFPLPFHGFILLII